MKKILARILLGIVGLIMLFALVTAAMYAVVQPKLERDWSLGQEELAHIAINDAGNVHINNLRDFNWSLPKGEVLNYKEADFNINDITGLQVVVSHFSALDAIAHVFLIFNLENGEGIAISVEGRREVGEEFTLLGGLTAQYEFMYVVGTAQDLVSLREMRGERLQVYDINATQSEVHTLFTSLTSTINKTHAKPVLYHLFFKNCVNSLTREVHRLDDSYSFSFWVSSFIPGSVGKMLEGMDVVL